MTLKSWNEGSISLPPSLQAFQNLMPRSVLACCLLLAAAAPCRAHFVWLASDDDGKAIVFFGESPAERNYKIPDCIAEAKVASSGADVPLETIEEDEFLGRRSKEPVAKDAVLETSCEYGVYYGMLLNYYAKHFAAADPAAWEKAPAAALKLDATPRLTKDGIELGVRLAGKPLKDAKATLIPAEGDSASQTTNAEGVATFARPKPGLVGFLVESSDSSVKGKLGEDEYTSAGNYLTVTCRIPGGADDKASAGLTPLPEPLTSFGGAALDGWLYVYGGHTGEEHAHSRENLSTHFRRMKLVEGASWEELPMQTPLQGMPLAAWNGRLFRIGGLSAKNAAGRKDDLHSVAEFASFDPATKTWTALPPLPEARSSHDAAVIGDDLYVVGGWQLAGSSEGRWLTTAWKINLADASADWEALPAPPFLRRALAIAAWEGKLAALGGMDDGNDVTQQANLFDPATGKWTELPNLPGDGMAGFGESAWSVGKDLYVCGSEGSLYRLDLAANAWREAGKLERARFFHRLLPAGPNALAIVGGASMEDGHLASIETIVLPSNDDQASAERSR